MTKKQPKKNQLAFEFNGWGGKRRGAGRKRKGGKARVPHVKRPALAARFPVHLTLDLVGGLPSLRRPRCMTVIWRALADSAHKQDFRVTQFSVQDRHLHLIVEAHNSRALSLGIQGLEVRLARRLNKMLGRSGAVFADRYHARILKTPREVFFALRYVLCNSAKHLSAHGWQDLGDTLLDRCCTAAYFDGWRRGRSLEAFRESGPGPPPVAPARTWLQRRGWRRYGLLNPGASPALGRLAGGVRGPGATRSSQHVCV
jgi:hypothetical protein